MLSMISIMLRDENSGIQRDWLIAEFTKEHCTNFFFYKYVGSESGAEAEAKAFILYGM